MKKRVDLILKKVLEKIEPSKKDLEIINNSLKNVIKELKKRIKKSKIKAEIFIGGSFAKKTVIKKDKYDVDVFLRFDKKYKKENISKITKKILNKMKNLSIIHGSRDYFKISFSPDFSIEVIPVIKVNNPKEAENITDLSYSHVNYIKKKIENKKILDEIRIAKAFCYANKCYGAESYIHGFSGYSLELLVYYYKNFMNFVKAMANLKNKEIIDIEKHFKKKKNILMDLNESKLLSPIILIDPTYKQRNALAALSLETFRGFQKACKKFLKNPSIKDFELKKENLEKIKKDSKKRKLEFIIIKIKTNKQKGDVAGSKLLKFYKYLEKEIEEFFVIKKKGFEYNQEQSAEIFFVAKKRNEKIIPGPKIEDKKNLKSFKKKHKKTFVKNKKIYAKEKITFRLKDFLKKWMKKNKKRLKEMYISQLKIV